MLQLGTVSPKNIWKVSEWSRASLCVRGQGLCSSSSWLSCKWSLLSTVFNHFFCQQSQCLCLPQLLVGLQTSLPASLLSGSRCDSSDPARGFFEGPGSLCVVFSYPLDVFPWQGGRENGWKCCLSKHAQLGRGKYGIEKLLDAWFEGRGGFFPPQSGCLWSA